MTRLHAHSSINLCTNDIPNQNLKIPNLVVDITMVHWIWFCNIFGNNCAQTTRFHAHSFTKDTQTICSIRISKFQFRRAVEMDPSFLFSRFLGGNLSLRIHPGGWSFRGQTISWRNSIKSLSDQLFISVRGKSFREAYVFERSLLKREIVNYPLSIHMNVKRFQVSVVLTPRKK
jgi:hypothetical protein